MADRLLDLCAEHGVKGEFQSTDPDVARVHLRHGNGITLDVAALTLDDAMDLAAEKLEELVDDGAFRQRRIASDGR